MLKLDIEYSYDFEVLGVITPLKEYKFAFYCNKFLNWDLYKVEDIRFSVSGGNMLFSNYEFISEHNNICLIKNKSIQDEKVKIKPYLLPEMKEFDYIIKLDSEVDVLKVDFVFDKIKEMPNIALVNKVNLEKLKNKENLIF